jgi:starch-binding outer membrane protein, SusD/RagB family
MPSMTTLPTRSRLRQAAFAAATSVLLAGCSPSDILDVTDPDIINPTDVTTPAGADATRIGALARFSGATSGGESFFLLGGLFSDEYNNADTFIDRQQIDQRITNLDNSFSLAAIRQTHRARLSAAQAIPLLQRYKSTGPTRDVAEMFFVVAFTENLTAEHMCNGLVFSDVSLEGVESYGSPITINAAFERALAHADSGLAILTGTTVADNRIRYALQVTRGRILLNLDRAADAAAAVAGVPTSFQYLVNNSLTADANQHWALNNSARRYSVSNVEGINGLNFATAGDPRLPVCDGAVAGCTAGTQRNRDDNTPITLYIQKKWPDQASDVAVSNGVEARLIEAEAQLDAGSYPGALTILNALRAPTGTGSGGVAGLAPLTDPGTAAGRADQLFRERAFWMWGTGHRTGDLRRLIRQYGRTQDQVFPTGAWHKQGNYGTDVNFAVPNAERNNPKVPQGDASTCMNRDA